MTIVFVPNTIGFTVYHKKFLVAFSRAKTCIIIIQDHDQLMKKGGIRKIIADVVHMSGLSFQPGTTTIRNMANMILTEYETRQANAVDPCLKAEEICENYAKEWDKMRQAIQPATRNMSSAIAVNAQLIAKHAATKGITAPALVLTRGHRQWSIQRSRPSLRHRSLTALQAHMPLHCGPL